MFAHSPDNEVESYGGEDEEEREKGEDKGDEGGEEGEDDKDKGEVNGRATKEGSLGSPGDGHTCPFILPKIWTVNDFKPTMTANIFKNLRDRYQIPDHILICLPRKFEKCSQGRLRTLAYMMHVRGRTKATTNDIASSIGQFS